MHFAHAQTQLQPSLTYHTQKQLRQQTYARPHEPCLSGTSARNSHLEDSNAHFSFVCTGHHGIQAPPPDSEIDWAADLGNSSAAIGSAQRQDSHVEAPSGKKQRKSYAQDSRSVELTTTAQNERPLLIHGPPPAYLAKSTNAHIAEFWEFCIATQHTSFLDGRLKCFCLSKH